MVISPHVEWYHHKHRIHITTLRVQVGTPKWDIWTQPSDRDLGSNTSDPDILYFISSYLFSGHTLTLLVGLVHCTSTSS